MAAGLGFKDFQTGEVLTAADVDGYLMQGIWVFASNAARDAAVTAPAEGNFAFTKDTNSLWYYDGAAWVASGATGDIEGVTAGVGISGGGTSGTVTVTNSMATEIAAKGDLIVGTGSQTFDNLTVGTNGHTLVADSSTATGLKWAAPAGGGKVLQVVQGTTTTATTITTGTFTDTTITATITPSSATSKVLVIMSTNVYNLKNGTTTYVSSAHRMMRDSTAILTYNPGIQSEGASASGGISIIQLIAMTHLDSPATTSATTYKIQAKTFNADTIIYQSKDSGEPVATGSIILMEIGA